MIPNAHLHAVAAMTQNRVLGKDGKMPWHLPADLQFFKRLTSGHPIIMGRKTWDSLGRALPNRRNIVLSRNASALAGAEVITTVDALAGLGLQGDVYVIGGAEIYRLLLPMCASVYLTELNFTAQGDTFFPEFEAEFSEVEVLETSAEAVWKRYGRAGRLGEVG
jgi:dihydrofolate reductase